MEVSVIGQVSEFLKNILPGSPVKALIESQALNQDWLKVLNWFVPVGLCISVLEIWLAAIVVYYGIMGILRFARLIS